MSRRCLTSAALPVIVALAAACAATTPAPTPNRPPQANCPPACAQIPDAAWIDPSAIPLDDHYRWVPLAPLSTPAATPRFLIDDACAAAAQPADQRDGAIAALAVLPNGVGQWQLRVQLVHWRGDPLIAGQRASAVVDAAASLLRYHCSAKAVGASVIGVSEQHAPGGRPGHSVTATITDNSTTPSVAHVYLIADPRSGTVVEVALSSTTPAAVQWPTTDDDRLLAAMVEPLCTAYVDSCGR